MGFKDKGIDAGCGEQAIGAGLAVQGADYSLQGVAERATQHGAFKGRQRRRRDESAMEKISANQHKHPLLPGPMRGFFIGPGRRGGQKAVSLFL